MQRGSVAPAVTALIVIVLVGVVASVAITVINNDGAPSGNSSQVTERGTYEMANTLLLEAIFRQVGA